MMIAVVYYLYDIASLLSIWLDIVLIQFYLFVICIVSIDIASSLFVYLFVYFILLLCLDGRRPNSS